MSNSVMSVIGCGVEKRGTRTFLPLNAAPKAVVSAPIRIWRPVAMWRANDVIIAVGRAQPKS
jgi:hypothetical protein